MKLFVYSLREYDEKEHFDKFTQEIGIEYGYCSEPPSLENASLAKDYDYISVVTSKISGELVDLFADIGIKMISTRTVGYDHIDLEQAKKRNINVCNAGYAPDGVADYTIMLVLMAVRHMKESFDRMGARDYSRKGLMGRNMNNLTIGVIGTGKIGTKVIERLSGFGCKIYAYDIFENKQVEKLADYVDIETLFRNSDIISFHIPAGDSNYHMINSESIKLMKDGVILVNTARGTLIDTKALIDGLESGKIGGAALDTLEGERGIFYQDLRSEVIGHRELAILKNMPNVIITPHIAYYTNDAVKDMAYSSVKSCELHNNNKENPYKIT